MRKITLLAACMLFSSCIKPDVIQVSAHTGEFRPVGWDDNCPFWGVEYFRTLHRVNSHGTVELKGVIRLFNEGTEELDFAYVKRGIRNVVANRFDDRDMPTIPIDPKSVTVDLQFPRKDMLAINSSYGKLKRWTAGDPVITIRVDTSMGAVAVAFDVFFLTTQGRMLFELKVMVSPKGNTLPDMDDQRTILCALPLNRDRYSPGRTGPAGDRLGARASRPGAQPMVSAPGR